MIISIAAYEVSPRPCDLTPMHASRAPTLRDTVQKMCICTSFQPFQQQVPITLWSVAIFRSLVFLRLHVDYACISSPSMGPPSRTLYPRPLTGAGAAARPQLQSHVRLEYSCFPFAPKLSGNSWVDIMRKRRRLKGLFSAAASPRPTFFRATPLLRKPQASISRSS